MIDRKFLSAYFGTAIYARGITLYNHGHVSDLDVREDPDTGVVTIRGSVESSRTNRQYQVRVTLSANENWIIDCECDCPYYESYAGPCKHIAAVLLAYIAETESSIIGNGISKYNRPMRATDQGIKKLLDEYTSAEKPALLTPSSPVILEPRISGIYDHSLEVSFNIYSGSGHKYVIKNIENFCDAIQGHGTIRYGKALEFVHSINAFSAASRPMIKYLMGLNDSNDTYAPNQNSFASYYRYGYEYGTALTRDLSLQGRYLDDFFQAAGSLPMYLYMQETVGQAYPTKLSLSQGMPQMQGSLVKADHGYLFSGSGFSYAKGREYLYFIDEIHAQIIYSQNTQDGFCQLLDFLNDDKQEDYFIDDRDLPAFAKYVYPLLKEQMNLAEDGFDAAAYVPAKPTYEIYLDLPYDNTITCVPYSVYKDEKFNLCAPSNDQGNRDFADEKEMMEFISHWFNDMDSLKHQMFLRNNDDMTYQLMTEGIPALQDHASVFVSEKLKKLQVRAMPKVSVGVSVAHDLLQLDLVSDTMSTKQLSEILSRYSSKKKYYRLKSGDFLTLDPSIDELADLKESLSLTASQIASGSVSLPSYRAQYLEELAQEEKNFTMSQDASFRSMIERMHESSSVKYELPSDLKATLRSYQKEGFDWLCALRDNHFAGLLADEMGLGKTLQIIAFLGAWKDRKKCLIVCPASLVYNWSLEIQHFLPSLPSRIISGSASMRAELIRSSQDNDVLITSYDLLKRDMDVYQDMDFSCEVIDEAQYIKNAGTQAAQAVKAIHAHFKAALTGTPIENRLSELWSIFDYLLPGFFYGYQKFRANFEVPIIKDNDENIEKRLQKMITPFVLRRLKKNVLKDLPDKLEEVYYASAEGEQKQLYDARVQNLKQQLSKQSDQEFKENKMMVLAELTRLRQICCDPSLVYDHYHGSSAKADLCIDMIRNAVEAGHKVLLFSQFTSMLEILTKRLGQAKLAYHLLEGSTPKKQRSDMVESFQKDDVPVFCISLKAGGTGLNLTAADIVIHYDPWWNTAVENQASDRAHRIGQKNVVSVYRLIIKDTIEERILDLQQSKNDLADKILSGEGMSSAKLSRKDLLEIL